ncbi:MAG: FAD:protein FMN transferase [Gammaproteobacteria bacterium]|nr:FAD:protein FMN transferase [Gammaproteobacteria bacterium]
MNIRKISIMIVLLPGVLIAACDRQLPELELTGATMGTSYSVKLAGVTENANTADLHREIQSIVDGLQQSMSTYIEESEVSRFNASRSMEWFTVSADLCGVVAEAQTISEFTGGAFDITVGPLVNLWGFGPDGSVAAPVDDADVAEKLMTVGHSHLRADCTRPALKKSNPELYIDLSAYAKGYAVDRVFSHVAESGFDNFLVEIGGELRSYGRNARNRPWSIAIENPDPASRSVHSIVKLSNKAFATSGDYRNSFEFEGVRYSHTINPRTGKPVTHSAASVTVVADSAAYADAVATALLVMGPDAGLGFAERHDIAAMFLVRTSDALEQRASRAFAAFTPD